MCIIFPCLEDEQIELDSSLQFDTKDSETSDDDSDENEL